MDKCNPWCSDWCNCGYPPEVLCWVESCGREATVDVELSPTWSVGLCDAHALDYEQKKAASRV